MQSFMNLKVVAFTPEETNIVYIPSEIILYQGSDFDIDKLYMMGASINAQGIYDSWSPFFNYSSVEMLKLSHNLTIPNKLTVNVSNTEGVDISDLITILFAKDESKHYVYNINDLKLTTQTNKDLLDTFSKVLNRVDKSTTILLPENLNEEDRNKFDDLITLVNEHNNYKLTFEQSINSIKK